VRDAVPVPDVVMPVDPTALDRNKLLQIQCIFSLFLEQSMARVQTGGEYAFD
jgi:hypothetical protein